MNIAEQLKTELSRRNTDLIVHYIGEDPSRFDEIIQLLLKGEAPLPQRAAWVVTHVADKNPDLCKPHLETLIVNIETFSHTGIHRCLLKVMADMEIPQELEGQLYDTCFRWLKNRFTPIAVKVHCMQILYNIVQKEPDLIPELRMILEDMSDDESAGIKSRTRQLLKSL